MSGKLYMPFPDSSSRQAIISIPQQALCHRPAEGDYVWIVNPQNHQVAKRKIHSGQIAGQRLPGGKRGTASRRIGSGQWVTFPFRRHAGPYLTAALKVLF